jgi:glycosyltransferase involved in cell wall biosynthesis
VTTVPPPRVTVIIPTYNWSSVLPFSIASVLGQTFADFELLVIGDACSDDSEEVVRRIADSRVRWINLEVGWGHQSGPNNEGLRQAKGDLIAYLGHDDLWLPHHLAAHVAAIDAGAELTYSIAALVAPRFVQPYVADPARRMWMPPTAVVHRRSLIERFGAWRDYHDVALGPDHEIWKRMYDGGARFELVPRFTAVKFPASWRKQIYRQRPSHEQAAWLARIQTEPGLEAELMELHRNRKFPRIVDFMRKATRMLREPSQWLAFLWRRPGARVAAIRRFKGADVGR